MADWIEHLPRAESFVTLQDHEDNITNNPICCLINLSKKELQKISKSILEQDNKTLVEKLKCNQWKNNNSVIEWFGNIMYKSS